VTRLPRPAQVCRDLLATLRVSDALRRRGARTVAEIIAMAFERAVLERAIIEDPGPEEFESWLVERCIELAPDSRGESWVRTTAVQIHDRWLAARDVLDGARAPS
jgi:hypothetical protein